MGAQVAACGSRPVHRPQPGQGRLRSDPARDRVAVGVLRGTRRTASLRSGWPSSSASAARPPTASQPSWLAHVRAGVARRRGLAAVRLMHWLRMLPRPPTSSSIHPRRGARAGMDGVGSVVATAGSSHKVRALLGQGRVVHLRGGVGVLHRQGARLMARHRIDHAGFSARRGGVRGETPVGPSHRNRQPVLTNAKAVLLLDKSPPRTAATRCGRRASGTGAGVRVRRRARRRRRAVHVAAAGRRRAAGCNGRGSGIQTTGGQSRTAQFPAVVPRGLHVPDRAFGSAPRWDEHRRSRNCGGTGTALVPLLAARTEQAVGGSTARAFPHSRAVDSVSVRRRRLGGHRYTSVIAADLSMAAKLTERVGVDHCTT